jgi:hypothetical protein
MSTCETLDGRASPVGNLRDPAGIVPAICDNANSVSYAALFWRAESELFAVRGLGYLASAGVFG